MRRLVAIALSLLLISGATASCTAARNLLGTRVSSCFRVLPVARSAVGVGSSPPAPAAFLGVQWLSADAIVTAINKTSGASPAPDSLTDRDHRGVCAVAFRGLFNESSVVRPWAPYPGQYRIALVVLKQSSALVINTILLGRVPRGLRFSKRYSF